MKVLPINHGHVFRSPKPSLPLFSWKQCFRNYRTCLN